MLNPEMSYPINKGLLKIIEQKNKDEIDMIIKICFIGSATVGKSSLIRQLVGEPFTSHM
jgi:GTPase SAR1 family protein